MVKGEGKKTFVVLQILIKMELVQWFLSYVTASPQNIDNLGGGGGTYSYIRVMPN